MYSLNYCGICEKMLGNTCLLLLYTINIPNFFIQIMVFYQNNNNSFYYHQYKIKYSYTTY